MALSDEEWEATLEAQKRDRAARPVERNLFEDIGVGVVSGVEGFVRDTAAFGLEAITLTTFDNERRRELQEGRLIGSAQTVTGRLIEGLTEFGIGFAIPFGALGKAGKLGSLGSKLVARTGIKAKNLSQLEKALKAGGFGKQAFALNAGRAAVAGALADTVLANEQENLSNLIEEYPSLANPLTAYLAGDPNDSELETRLKNVLEGAILGVGVDAATFGLGRLFRHLKAFKVAKNTIEHTGSIRKAQEAVEKTLAEPEAIREIPEAVPPPEVDLPTAKATIEGWVSEEQIEAIGKAMDEVPGVANPRELSAMERAGLQLRGDINPRTLDLDEPTAQLVNATEVVLRNKMRSIRPGRPLSDANLEERISATIRSDPELVGVIGAVDAEDALNKMAARVKGSAMELEDAFIRAQAELAVAGSVARQAGDLIRSIDASDLEGMAVLRNLESRYAELTMEVRGSLSVRGRSLRGLQVLPEHVRAVGSLNTQAARDAFDAAEGGAKAMDDDLGKMKRLLEKNGSVSEVFNARRFDESRMRWRFAQEHYIGSLLSGPLTLAVNTISNATFAAFRPLEAATGAALKGAFHKAIGQHQLGDALLRESAMRRREFRNLVDLTANFRRFLNVAGESFNTSDTASIVDSAGRLKSDLAQETGGITAANARELGSDQLRELMDKNPTMATAIDWWGKIARGGGRALKATDDGFKYLVAHSFMESRLHFEALQKGLRGNEIGQHVAAGLKRGFDGNAILTEASALRTFRQMAAEEGLRGPKLAARARELTQDALENGTLGADLALAQEALEQARLSTFTHEVKGFTNPDGSTPESITQGTLRFRSQHPWLTFVLPFVTTPSNILREGFDRTSFGAIKPTVVAAWSAVKGLDPKYSALNQARGALTADLLSTSVTRQGEAMGKMMTAAGVMGTVSSLFSAGKITGGGPSDREVRRSMEQAGWKPYSILIGDTYVSYQRIDPFATFLGSAADLMESGSIAYQENGDLFDAAMAGLFSAVAQNVTSKTYLKGLSNLLDAVEDPGGAGSRFAGSVAGGFVPLGSAFGQVTRAIDPLERELRGLTDSVRAKLPMYGFDTPPPSRNILGEKIFRPRGAPKEGPLRILTLVNPFLYENVSDDIILKEMGDLDYGFTPPGVKQNGLLLRDYKNADGQDAYDRWLELHGEVRIGGKSLRQSLRKLIQSRGYRELDPETTFDLESPRVAEIKRVINRYKRKALDRVRREFPEFRQDDSRRTQAKRLRRSGQSAEGLFR